MEKDLTNRNLGLRHHKCRVCGSEGAFRSYLVREMMNGTRDEFEYFACDKCLCLQIAEVPANLGDYYGNAYYSMHDKRINKESDFNSPITNSEKVLDVGCGIGAWLYEQAEKGHDNLYGCDPFIEKDIQYGDRAYIWKCDITEVNGDGTFDAVRMRDSFEHVDNPEEVLEKAKKLIKDDGVIMMTIPTYPNIAFDLFETHWYQLDAPRHIILHSLLSLKYLADNCGLIISKVEYDADETQIIRSFFYQHGISYYETTGELVSKYFSDKEIENIAKMSEEANRNHLGDHMRVWFHKNNN